MTVINWNEVLENAKSASFSVIPKGDYHIRIEEPNATTSSTGKPMIKFRCRVMSGPHAKASLLTQQVLTIDNPNAVAIFVKFLGAFGVGADFLAALGTTADLTPIAQALDGREATAVVEIEKWQDENRNQVKRFKPLSGAPATGVGPVAYAPPAGVPAPGAIPMPNVPNIPVTQLPPPSVPVPAPVPQAAPPAPAPVAAPVPPPVAPQAPQAPQVATPAAPPTPPAPPAPAGAPAFDFTALPPEMQQQIMAQFAATQAQAAQAAPSVPQPEPAPAAPAVVAPPLPY